MDFFKALISAVTPMLKDFFSKALVEKVIIINGLFQSLNFSSDTHAKGLFSLKAI